MAGASQRGTNIHPRTLGSLFAHKISDNAAKNGLVRDDEDVTAVFSAAAALEFHDDGLEAGYDVAVGFAAEVAVLLLVDVFPQRLERGEAEEEGKMKHTGN